MSSSHTQQRWCFWAQNPSNCLFYLLKKCFPRHWCSNVICQLCIKASVLVLSLSSKHFNAWGKWSGRSRGCAAWLHLGSDKDGRCVIGLWSGLCIILCVPWNTFFFFFLRHKKSWAFISSLNVYPFTEKIKEEMQFVTTASHFCSLFTNMLWHSPYLIKENRGTISRLFHKPLFSLFMPS